MTATSASILKQDPNTMLIWYEDYGNTKCVNLQGNSLFQNHETTVKQW